MSLAGEAQTSSDTCSYRNRHPIRHRRVGPPWTLLVHRHFRVILVLGWFLTFVATSSPHHVHHLGDAARPPQRPVHQHHEHHDQAHRHDHAAPSDSPASQPNEGRSSPLPTCVVLLVLQSMPILEADQALISVPVTSQHLGPLAPWCRPLEVCASSTQIRAPPSVMDHAEQV